MIKESSDNTDDYKKCHKAFNKLAASWELAFLFTLAIR